MNDFHEIHFPWIRESNLIEDIDDNRADIDAFDAWRSFTEKKLDRESLLGVHWDVMFHRNKKIAGMYRKYDVRVGYHVAPDFKSVPNLMEKWFMDFGDMKTSESIRVAHLVFERIHPFADGNGRVGRMVMNYQRIRAGLEPCVLYAADRRSYYQWFSEVLPNEYGWAARLVNSAVEDARARREKEAIGWLAKLNPKPKGLM